MLTRRNAIAGLGLTALPWNAAAQAVQDDAFPAFPSGLHGYENLADVSPSESGGLELLGNQEPEEIDKRVANRIIELAPYNCRPIDVALYLRGIGQGQIPPLGASDLDARVGRHFVRGWPVRYNPIIIEFFKATSLNPLAPNQGGDATHWCAAFVNWCIARARSTGGAAKRFTQAELLFGTRSASSGSFRCWGSPTSTPAFGDIIVWANDGSVNGCSPGSGHVAFYDSPVDDDHWTVVGGNQRDPSHIAGATQSAVIRKKLPRSYATTLRNSAGEVIYKRVHSFRSADFLR